MSAEESAGSGNMLVSWNKALERGIAMGREGNPRGLDVVRRVSRIIRFWSSDGGVPQIEEAASAAYRGEGPECLEAGVALASLVKEFLSGRGPGEENLTEPSLPGPSPTMSPDRWSSFTVLLAEDDPVSAALAEGPLGAAGFRVIHFPDGTSAMEGAQAHEVSAFILDVKMPGMDGFQLLEKLREYPAYRHTPVMMLTSVGGEEDVVRGFELGADDYVLKPFSPPEVLARLSRLLED